MCLKVIATTFINLVVKIIRQWGWKIKNIYISQIDLKLQYAWCITPSFNIFCVKSLSKDNFPIITLTLKPSELGVFN